MSQPQLVRPLFRNGDILTDRSLNSLANWASDRDAVETRRHGWGICHGLTITWSPENPWIGVSSGTAIDPSGRYIAISEDQRLSLGKLLPKGEEHTAGERWEYDLWVVGRIEDRVAASERRGATTSPLRSDRLDMRKPGDAIATRVETFSFYLRPKSVLDIGRDEEIGWYRELEASFKSKHYGSLDISELLRERSRMLASLDSLRSRRPDGVALGRLNIQFEPGRTRVQAYSDISRRRDGPVDIPGPDGRINIVERLGETFEQARFGLGKTSVLARRSVWEAHIQPVLAVEPGKVANLYVSPPEDGGGRVVAVAYGMDIAEELELFGSQPVDGRIQEVAKIVSKNIIDELVGDRISKIEREIEVLTSATNKPENRSYIRWPNVDSVGSFVALSIIGALLVYFLQDTVKMILLLRIDIPIINGAIFAIILLCLMFIARRVKRSTSRISGSTDGKPPGDQP